MLRDIYVEGLSRGVRYFKHIISFSFFDSLSEK